MTPNDDLIKRVAAGDGEAFAELVTPHRAELLRFAVRMLGGDGQAGEEVVQESMLSAYCALKQGASPKSVRPWLFVIVRNCALNYRRRSQPTYPLADEDGHVVQRTPNEAAEQGEWIDWLMGAIADLPSRQRQALIGRELEGRSHAELAASLGTSVLAVKTLLHRARGRLRMLRAESMLSVPLLVKGRAAGLKAGLGVLGQALAAASVTTLIVLAVHAGGGSSVRAAGLPVVGARASTMPRRLLSAASPRRRPTQRQIEHEGQQAITRCNHGLSVRGTSPAGLGYAIGHLSADELEYTDCEQVLRNAALDAALDEQANVYFAESPGGLLLEAAHRDRLAVKPAAIVVFPHGGWSIIGLHWASWGKATAQATGTSLENQCEPGCADGPPAGSPAASFQRSPAKVILWSPGPFHGHTVYRCFRVTADNSVPSSVGGCYSRNRAAPTPTIRTIGAIGRRKQPRRGARAGCRGLAACPARS